MICILALIVFGLLGIFSASYRKLFKESVDCVFRKATLRPCRSNLDQRLKSEITGKIMKKNPKAGRFIYKYFPVFSWILLILLLVSMVFVARGTYFFIKYDNCNGPESTEYCIFNPHQTAPISTTGDERKPENLKAPYTTGEFGVGPDNASVTIIEFGCFTCPYTKEAEPALQKVLNKYKGTVKYYYFYYPIPAHSYSMNAAVAAECAKEQGKFMEFRERLFELNPYITADDVRLCCEDLGMNLTQFNTCLNGTEARVVVNRHVEAGKTSGIYGTPTFFINDQPLVGPKSAERMDKMIEDALSS
jgi:protein-disulfide isomerase